MLKLIKKFDAPANDIPFLQSRLSTLLGTDLFLIDIKGGPIEFDFGSFKAE